MIRKEILVVDDVSDWRELLQSTLRRNKYKVDTASDYEEALKKISHQSVELAIVDLRLDLADENNRDGMKLLKELNKRRINAIVITGYGNDELREKASSLEVITFMEKSLIARSLSTLKQVIQSIFSEMEARDKLRTRQADDFLRGKAVGYSEEASGYPLRKSLQDETKEWE